MKKELSKYVTHSVFVTMPNGINRRVQVKHNMKATWNMRVNGRQKSCPGKVYFEDDVWKFSFKNESDEFMFMNYYTPKRVSYEDVSDVAIAKRRYDEARSRKNRKSDDELFQEDGGSPQGRRPIDS